MFSDIVQYSDLKQSDKILEIGCGTGQATQGFIELGFKNITCVELGSNLANITREKYKTVENVQVHNSSFEDWEGNASHYDLAISGTAFHFINPKVGYPKVAKLLKNNRTTAFFWTIHVPSYADIHNQIRDQYKKYAPHLDDSQRLTPQEELENRIRIMEETNLLKDFVIEEYLWKDNYTSEKYVSLLNTNSKHRFLPEDSRKNLFNGIKNIIDKNGGIIQKQQMVALFLAKIK